MSQQFPKVCFDRILPRDLRRFAEPGFESSEGAVRAAVLKAKKWPNGSPLRIRFMSGSPSQQDVVRQFATEWTRHANLKFNFSNDIDSEIRITFDASDGAWSYLGTDCQDIPLNQATMNLGWQDQGVVLHEFGHAIGLIHEHQNPSGGIKWNKDQVYRDLGGPPNNWPRNVVDNNMFRTYSVEQINSTALDKKSIMLYAIPASWTTDGFQSSPNEVLSDTDRSFIGHEKNYPMPGAPNAGPVELPVIENKATQADIGRPGERDLFKFKATSAGRYTIETTGPTDVIMSLYGPSSQTALIKEDDDGGTDRNAKIVADLVAGDYFVQVRHFNAGGGTGQYSIKVSK